MVKSLFKRSAAAKLTKSDFHMLYQGLNVGHFLPQFGPLRLGQGHAFRGALERPVLGVFPDVDEHFILVLVHVYTPFP